MFELLGALRGSFGFLGVPWNFLGFLGLGEASIDWDTWVPWDFLGFLEVSGKACGFLGFLGGL